MNAEARVRYTRAMTAALSAPLDRITRRFIAEGYFPGALLRVEQHGAVLLESAWGDARTAETPRAPMTPETLFDAASLTKLFTATAVLRLVSTGALALDTRVGDLLELPPPLEAALHGIHITELLTHTSGIPWWYPFYTRRHEPFTGILQDVVPARPRRGEVVYSDLNFMILGLMIEQAMRKGLAAAMEELVLGPLGLRRTSFCPPLGAAAATESGNRIEKRMVSEMGLTFDGWRDDSRPIVGEPNDGNCFYYFKGAAGHAGIFASAGDLCRLGRLYLDGGRVDGKPWLAAGLAERATREQAPGRGLGFQLGQTFPPGACGHTGFTGTCLALFPDRGVAAAVLTNRLHVFEPRDITPYRMEVLHVLAAQTSVSHGGGGNAVS